MELVKRVTQEQMTRYSGPGNIHSDLRVAGRAGLERTVAQGMMTLAYASELLTKMYGAAWLERGQIDVKFIGLVYAGDVVTVRALESAEGCEIEAENQDGQKVMVGRARLR